MSHVFLSPLGLGLVLLGLVWALRRAGRLRLARIPQALGLICVMLMTPWGANSLVKLLEGQPTTELPACARDAQRPLVLLTGGLDRPARSEQDFAALSPASQHRLFELLNAQLISTQRTLLISGGSDVQGVTESRLMGQLALRMGVAPEQLRLDERAHSTRENAEQSANLLGTTRSVALVTSALHMPRAILAFQQQGFDVCPIRVDSVYVPPGGLGYYLPQSSALRKSESALHEMVGWLVYRWR
ncbi:MAG TPA: YdcF family protein [Aquabacterium sp.]|nr:YdcF family protein [Aquabacterium sp.]